MSRLSEYTGDDYLLSVMTVHFGVRIMLLCVRVFRISAVGNSFVGQLCALVVKCMFTLFICWSLSIERVCVNACGYELFERTCRCIDG